MEKIKNYLMEENARNCKNAQLYADILRIAFPDSTSSLIAHHLTFVLEGEDPNEIPSADALIFDHDIMGRVFGGRAMEVMRLCAETPTERRDEILGEMFYYCGEKP